MDLVWCNDLNEWFPDRDMGESAMGMYPPQAQLDSPLRGLASPGWCSEVGYVLGAGGGQHLVTRSEVSPAAPIS